ncbi:DUF2789 domain-containing protein [Simiduia curdlanivorans]|uniref:DUF2789 domain-containing protein n=1 Tax=Simiduia curdlanivorans TaxID=1492769 RepID=A0ABV8V5H0_9GAMM|nr:DUF2789 domain-containing protein [Simiduia curdlanivorans]MDN3640666.1 DUF2789 domain-containing protein [Simiduia curdlanivorans]
MEVQHHHAMAELFSQLGLDSSKTAIDQFIRNNHLRHQDGELYRAIFWNPAQAQFIKQAIEEDAQWAEVVDELDARLRR